jgi:hypothetical protein
LTGVLTRSYALLFTTTKIGHFTAEGLEGADFKQGLKEGDLELEVFVLKKSADCFGGLVEGTGARRGHQRHCHAPVALPW